MKQTLFLLAVLALTGACRTAPQKELTLMTYNVGAFSKYMGSSLPDVADIILQSEASLVSLNELDSCNRRHDEYQLQMLADRLGGWDYHFVQAFPFAGGAYGNGVVSRSPVLKRFGIALSKDDGKEPRSVAVVETEECVFASVHLDFGGQTAALTQIAELNNGFTAHYSGSAKPVFLCGDMNATPGSAPIEALCQAWEQLSGTAFTFSTQNPQKCIDYFFALKAAAPVSVLSCQVLTEGTQDASDHFPVLLQVKY